MKYVLAHETGRGRISKTRRVQLQYQKVIQKKLMEQSYFPWPPASFSPPYVSFFTWLASIALPTCELGRLPQQGRCRKAEMLGLPTWNPTPWLAAYRRAIELIQSEMYATAP